MNNYRRGVRRACGKSFAVALASKGSCELNARLPKGVAGLLGKIQEGHPSLFTFFVRREGLGMLSLHRQPPFRLRYGGSAGKRLITEFCAVVLFFVSRGWITVRLHNGGNLGGRTTPSCGGLAAGVMDDT